MSHVTQPNTEYVRTIKATPSDHAHQKTPKPRCRHCMLNLNMRHHVVYAAIKIGSPAGVTDAGVTDVDI